MRFTAYTVPAFYFFKPSMMFAPNALPNSISRKCRFSKSPFFYLFIFLTHFAVPSECAAILSVGIAPPGIRHCWLPNMHLLISHVKYKDASGECALTPRIDYTRIPGANGRVDMTCLTTVGYSGSGGFRMHKRYLHCRKKKCPSRK